MLWVMSDEFFRVVGWSLFDKNRPFGDAMRVEGDARMYTSAAMLIRTKRVCKSFKK